MAGLKFGEGATQVTLNPAAVAKLLSGPDGPVYSHMIKIGEKVKDRAKQEVGVDTGKLRDSIVKRLTMESGELTIFVGTDVPYALYHHEGTYAHGIDGNPWLAFHIRGKLIIVRHVNHPGTRPNRFLLRALDSVNGLF